MSGTVEFDGSLTPHHVVQQEQTSMGYGRTVWSWINTNKSRATTLVVLAGSVAATSAQSLHDVGTVMERWTISCCASPYYIYDTWCRYLSIPFTNTTVENIIRPFEGLIANSSGSNIGIMNCELYTQIYTHGGDIASFVFVPNGGTIVLTSIISSVAAVALPLLV